MSKIELILKDITDVYVREDFFRIQNYFNNSSFFDGDFSFFEIEIPSANSSFSAKHGLSFIPQDVIILSVIGNHNFGFIYDLFDKDRIYISSSGPCVVRFLLGRLNKNGVRPIRDNYPYVPLNGTIPVPGGGGSSSTIASESPKLVQTFVTDPATSAGDLVRISGINTVTKISDNFSTSIPNGIFGVVWQKPTSTSAKVLFIGIMNGFSGFTPGLPLFISVTGSPTHVVPMTGMVQQIGFAISSTQFFIQLGQALRRS